MRITRNDILTIAKKPYQIGGIESTTDDILYEDWVIFIENNKDYFIWYEDTTDGKYALENIDKVPEWAKERVLYSLNKRKVYTSEKLVMTPTDLVIGYSESDKRISISLDKNLSVKVAKVLLAMSNHLNGFLLKDGNIIIDEERIENLI